ncbi:V-type proton ATPase subunit S1-like protein isoform X3 [Tachyglossus aculeatus]|uniref:V-type proton ATPase subunit S1-like protein isoform X3 n=1 Tax=Tachyglossus aculeatus TaxID=9261 RepID=UPI0018F74DEB|nr:V-type proton ATPase subunit S1-like protein isoform X3 [Tachyglossus aculeatus]
MQGLTDIELSSQTFSNQHLVFRNDQQMDGDVKKNLSFKPSPPSQVIYSEFSQKENSERELWKAFSQNHQSPLNVSVNGSLCILFWAKRITIQFKDQTQLDLTDKTFGNQATVDVRESNCSEENATLSLKFGDVDNLKGLDIRFSLARYNKLPVQSWFSLQRIQILYNNSIQATFNATRIYAPSSYSFHCERVSSLQKYDPLLIPSSTNDISRLWEVTFIDFQIQAFRIKEVMLGNATRGWHNITHLIRQELLPTQQPQASSKVIEKSCNSHDYMDDLILEAHIQEFLQMIVNTFAGSVWCYGLTSPRKNEVTDQPVSGKQHTQPNVFMSNME